MKNDKSVTEAGKILHPNWKVQIYIIYNNNIPIKTFLVGLAIFNWLNLFELVVLE